MIKFVNAKINIGLQIVRRRADGYHDLQSVFYPVGKEVGTPENPVAFCDILEITPDVHDGGFEYVRSGRPIDCPLEKDLVYRAARLFFDTVAIPENFRIELYKRLPDGAGMGGGSADAAFVLSTLNEMTAAGISERELMKMARMLGADCPFFIYNRPAYVEGIGDIIEPIELDLSGYHLLIVKPRIYISTKVAFAGVTPHEASFDLRNLSKLPVKEWQGVVKNDFEDSLFPQFPELAEIKSQLIEQGAAYASLTGSGSVIYGLFADHAKAREAEKRFTSNPTIEHVSLLKI